MSPTKSLPIAVLVALVCLVVIAVASNETPADQSPAQMIPASSPMATWHVSITGNDLTGTGTSGNPFRTITRAVTAAASHDRILIGAGTYNEHVNVYAKDLTFESQNPASPAQIYSDTSVAFSAMESPGIMLYNLRLHGEVNPAFSTSGGGARLYNSIATFRRCVIDDCMATAYGGGIYAYNARVIVDSCEIRNNQARWNFGNGGGLTNMGGGICIDGDYSTISNSIITGNYCGEEEGYGGGIALIGEHFVVRNCVIDSNTAEAIYDGVSTGYETRGGGLYIQGDTNSVYGNEIFGNQARSISKGTGARSFAGGAYIFGKRNEFYDNRVDDNEAYSEFYENVSEPYIESAGGGVYLKGTTVTNNTFDDNSAISRGRLNSPTFYCYATTVAVGGGGKFDSCDIRYNTFTYNEVSAYFEISATCNPLCMTQCERALVGGAGATEELSTDDCNIVYGNSGATQWTGYLPGDIFYVDPLYCNRLNRNFYVSTISPALPGNNSCGVLIGSRVDGCLPLVSGDANGDGAINLADAVFVINYVFKGGPAPDPYEAGDANCSAAVDLADAVFLINYIFKGGPEPGC